MSAVEAEVWRSEERFREMANALPLIVWTATPEGAIDFTSAAMVAYSGLAAEQILERGWLDAVHPDDVPRCLEAWADALHTKTAYQLDFRIRRHDGEMRWFAVGATPICDAAGNVSKWYGSAVDVHETRVLGDRLRVTLEAIGDGFLTLDAASTIEFVNHHATSMGPHLGAGVPLAEAWPALAAALSDHPNEASVEALFAEGRAWISARVHPTPGGGRAVYLRDVTSMRETEEALRASEERFRFLARATHDAIWEWNLATNELWWNEGYWALFGHDPKSAPPDLSSWTAHVHPEDLERVLTSLDEAVAAGSAAWSAEYRFLRADGSYAHVFDRGYLVAAEDGHVTRMIGGMTDLSERMETEARLREQAELIDAASDAILVRTLDGRVSYMNRQAEALYGWSREEALGRDVREMQFAGTVAELERANQAVLEHGTWAGTLSQSTKDGRALTVLGRWTLVRDGRGRPRSVLVINTDVTGEKAREEQLLRAQRMESIGTLAGGIAHDLNNVLLPVLFSAELLLQDETDAERREDLESIMTSAERGAAMIRQLLTFARGYDGARAAVDVRQVVTEVATLLRDTFPKSIDLRVELPEQLWLVDADATQLHQILMNLCVNARDAMPRGGRLSVSIGEVVVDEVYALVHPDATPGRYVVVRVEDTGEGMTSATRDRIFEPFFTTKRVGSGTGLGLSTSHALVKSHGGFITVYSELSVGTRFHVHLPARDSLEDAAGVSESGTSVVRPGSELVLVIDDEDAVCRMVKRTLERFGYRVLTAENGAQGIALFAAHRREIAVVITDMVMPIMDGHATIAALRALDPKLPIIASSGLDAEGRAVRIEELDVGCFLSKPYTAAAMFDALARALDRPRERS